MFIFCQQAGRQAQGGGGRIRNTYLTLLCNALSLSLSLETYFSCLFFVICSLQSPLLVYDIELGFSPTLFIAKLRRESDHKS